MTALARTLVALLADPIADALAEHDAVPLRLVLEEMGRESTTAPPMRCVCGCGKWLPQGGSHRLYFNDLCKARAARVRDAGRWRHG